MLRRELFCTKDKLEKTDIDDSEKRSTNVQLAELQVMLLVRFQTMSNYKTPVLYKVHFKKTVQCNVLKSPVRDLSNLPSSRDVGPL